MPGFQIMGVVNVTPDSFSAGGRSFAAGGAVEHGLARAAAGADVLDVGGESTRAGAQPVDEETERRRVVPVIRRLAVEAGVAVSVDTTKAAVAAAALEAGATIVNDVSAGRFDPAMMPVVAEAGAGYVLMHMPGTPATMQHDPRYGNVVGEVTEFLAGRLAAAPEAGIPPDRLVAAPRIGFGKTAAHHWELLARLSELAAALAAPVMAGPPRKGFIGAALGGLGPDEREEGTL